MRLLIHCLLLRPVLRLLFGVNIEGRDHLAGLDRFLVVTNHNSHLDVLLLFSMLPARSIRRTHVAAAKDYFGRNPILFRIVDYLFRPIWIDREERTGDPLGEMADHLRDGHNVILFPEGSRGEPGSIGRFRRGVGRLATVLPEVPIVPVVLCGPEKSLPRTSSIPLPIYNTILIGPPQALRGDSLDVTESLERVIRELSESEMAHCHRRVPRLRDAEVIAVLGIDGSGKSTLSRQLARELSAAARVCLITDEIEMYEHGERQEIQPLLTELARGMIGRQAKTAKSLERYKVPKLAEILMRDQLIGQVRRWYSPSRIVLDGSPLLNLVAWSRLYDDRELDLATCSAMIRALTGSEGGIDRRDPVFQRFPQLRILKRLALAMPDLVLMLDVAPEVSMERIRKRGGHQQVHETAEKLARLRAGYLLVCDAVSSELRVSMRILDGHAAPAAVIEAALAAAREPNHGEVAHG